MIHKNVKFAISQYDKFASITGLIPDNPNNAFESGSQI